MSSSSIPSTFLKNTLQNGIGRYVCQLQRLTLCFCKNHAGSKGMRDYIEHHLLDFTRANPGIVVYLKPRRHRTAVLQVEYLNGYFESFNVHQKDKDEISKWVEYMRTRSGVQIQRLRKPWHTENPSIQGVWHPFTNTSPSLNVAQFPDKELGKYPQTEMSATDYLLSLNKEISKEKSSS
ncbi:39S ribosomal protein L43, mitochondrial-like [Argonauta hians]